VPELRIDPLTGLRAIVATDRALRPGGAMTVAAPQPIDPGEDPFAEGHEQRTPPELYAVRPPGSEPDGPGWTVRAFANRYPALDVDSPPPPRDAKPDLFAALPARGSHEVIVNAPQPVQSLAELETDQVRSAVEVWRMRMRAHEPSAYPHLIVNERRDGGSSQPHTHAQLFALDFVPAAIARERERAHAYATRTMGFSMLADIVQEEVRRRERIVAIDDEAVLICPYASYLPYQLMLVPRRGRPRFQDDGATGAALLHDGLRRLARRFGSSPPLNLWVRTAPRDAEQFCWRIDVVPRLSGLSGLAGLELGTGVHLNPVAPEQATAELRDA